MCLDCARARSVDTPGRRVSARGASSIRDGEPTTTANGDGDGRRSVTTTVMVRAARASADERTPLVVTERGAAVERHRSVRRAVTAVMVTFGAIGAVSMRRDASSSSSSMWSSFLALRPVEAFSGVVRPTHTFTVDASCPSEKVRSKDREFWSEPLTITEAKVVYHNYRGSDFFTSRRGVVMSPVAGNPRKFTVTTNKVNYEYGFELTNSRGQVARDIGLPGSSTSQYMWECTAHFGFRNRLVTGSTTRVFGTCESECPAGEGEGEPTAPAAEVASPTCEKETLTYSLGAGEETPFVYTAPAATTFAWAHREMRLEISSFQTRRTASIRNISIRTGTGANERELFSSAFDSPTEWNYTYTGCSVSRAFNGLYTTTTTSAEMTAVSRDTFTTVAGQPFTVSFDLDLTLDPAQSRAQLYRTVSVRLLPSEASIPKQCASLANVGTARNKASTILRVWKGQNSISVLQVDVGHDVANFGTQKINPTSVASTNVKRVSITYAHDAASTCAT